MRRGMPNNPEKCIGKKVRFIAMKFSQKCQVPSFSLIMRPNIFGK